MMAREVFLFWLGPLNYYSLSICVAAELYAKSMLHFVLYVVAFE